MEALLGAEQYYEERYIHEQFIIGLNLEEEYRKQCAGEHDPDDDDY
jgi:hypothetical protein